METQIRKQNADARAGRMWGVWADLGSPPAPPICHVKLFPMAEPHAETSRGSPGLHPRRPCRAQNRQPVLRVGCSLAVPGPTPSQRWGPVRTRAVLEGETAQVLALGKAPHPTPRPRRPWASRGCLSLLCCPYFY